MRRTILEKWAKRYLSHSNFSSLEIGYKSHFRRILYRRGRERLEEIRRSGHDLTVFTHRISFLRTSSFYSPHSIAHMVNHCALYDSRKTVLITCTAITGTPPLSSRFKQIHTVHLKCKYKLIATCDPRAIVSSVTSSFNKRDYSSE